MTKKEFYEEYLRLSKVMPAKYGMQDIRTMTLLFDIVKNLSVAWMHSCVNRIIKENKTDFDWRKAASGEIRAKTDLEKTTQLLEETQREPTLERYLEQNNASSILDLIKFKE